MARRGDTSAPKLNAKQRYDKRVQRNRIISQLERLDDQYTVDEIRNAGNDAWYELGGSGMTKDPLTGKWGGGTYTVADGDTFSTIAGANGTTPADLLKQNPDVNSLKTGMVINSRPTGMNQRGFFDGPSGTKLNTPGGLPSNAALGALGDLSTYHEGEKDYIPGGRNNANPVRSGRNVLNPVDQFSFGNATNAASGAYGLVQNAAQGLRNNILNPVANAIPDNLKRGAINAAALAMPSPLGLPGALINQLAGAVTSDVRRDMQSGGRVVSQNPSATSTTHPAYREQQPGKPLFNRPYSMTKDDSYPEELWYMIDKTDYVPTQAQMMYLKSQGYAVPNVTSSGGGGGGNGYSSRGRGRGGGGRNTPKTPMGGQDYANTERTPSFGNGAGFKGLVNWRI